MQKNVKVHVEKEDDEHGNDARKNSGNSGKKKSSEEKEKKKKVNRRRTTNDKTGDDLDLISIHDAGEKKQKKKKKRTTTEKLSSDKATLTDQTMPNPAAGNTAENPSNQNEGAIENGKSPYLGKNAQISQKVTNIALQPETKKPTLQRKSYKDIGGKPLPSQKSRSSYSSNSFESLESVNSTAPGLDFLKDTSTLYVFKREDPLEFIPTNILISSYNVLNDKGETIYYIGEIQEKCFLCSTWSNRLPVYSVQGQLVMSIQRRNPSCCSRPDEQMAKFTDVDAVVYSEDSKHPPKPAYHVSLSTGEFLGHVKAFNSGFDDLREPFKYILLDAKFQELYKIRAVKPADVNAQIATNPFYEDTDSHFDIYFKHRKLGNIHSRANVTRYGIVTKSAKCFQATFPPTLTDAQKALILGLMAIAKCQTISSDDEVCETCCIILCKYKCAIL